MNKIINELLDALERSTSIMNTSITNCRSCDECEKCGLFPCLTITQTDRNKAIIDKIRTIKKGNKIWDTT